LGIAQRFEKIVMARYNLVPKPSAIRHLTAAALVDAVAADPFAIGIARFSELGNARKLAIRGACGMNFHATAQSLKTEDYPLNAPLFLYTPARRLPKIAREFLTYLRSPAAQRVVRSVRFVDQSVDQIPIADQGRRFANAIVLAGAETKLADLQRMISILRPAKRLTITFRFEAGSAKLDAQSRLNIVLLARLLEAGKYDGQDLLFVGFSDGMGDAAVNLKIAKKRATAVRAAVLKAADTLKPQKLSLEVEAFGEALPMACDDTDWGRQVNRRVEVWVK
jgi:phosphate transport system substrate-binding protein